MSTTVAKLGLLGAVLWGVLGAGALLRGMLMLAGTCFVLLSFSIYVYETHGE